MKKDVMGSLWLVTIDPYVQEPSVRVPEDLRVEDVPGLGEFLRIVDCANQPLSPRGGHRFPENTDENGRYTCTNCPYQTTDRDDVRGTVVGDDGYDPFGVYDPQETMQRAQNAGLD